MIQISRKSRRQFITSVTAIGIGGITGCTSFGGADSGGGSGGSGGVGSEDSDGDGVPDTEDDFPSDSTRSTLLDQDTETFDLNEDYYQYFTFSPTRSATLSYQARVQGDIPIDLILTDETNFRYFEDGSDWEYYPEGSDLDTLNADVDFRLGTDREYYLIVDNTNQGRAAPPANFDNDRIEVDFGYKIYY